MALLTRRARQASEEKRAPFAAGSRGGGSLRSGARSDNKGAVCLHLDLLEMSLEQKHFVFGYIS